MELHSERYSIELLPRVEALFQLCIIDPAAKLVVEVNNMHLIDRNSYEQLDQLMWDTARTLLEPEEALLLYEQRWAYVDEARLTAQEQALIAELTRTVGKGCFLPTNV